MKTTSVTPSTSAAPLFDATQLQSQVRSLVAVLHQINGSPAKLSPQDETSLQAAIELASSISTHVEVLSADANPNPNYGRRTDRNEADFRARRNIDATRTLTTQERADFEAGLPAGPAGPLGHTEEQFRRINGIAEARPLTVEEQTRFDAQRRVV